MFESRQSVFYFFNFTWVFVILLLKTSFFGFRLIKIVQTQELSSDGLLKNLRSISLVQVCVLSKQYFILVRLLLLTSCRICYTGEDQLDEVFLSLMLVWAR